MRFFVKCMLPLLIFVSCGSKRDYSEITGILSCWSESIHQLDYSSYATMEAYPKNKEQFLEMYHDYYITQLIPVKIEDESETVLENRDGKKYIRKKVYFSGVVVMRNQEKSTMQLQGDVELVKFINEEPGRGWLFANRTFIRTDKMEYHE